LNALHTYKRENVPPRALAEEACDLEINILGEPIGKQDQYLAAFGGITCLNIAKDGKVEVEPLNISFHSAAELESNIMIFYTGVTRSASHILKDQKEAGERNDEKIVSSLHAIKQIGIEIREALEKGELKQFGKLLNTHWETKKKLSGKISSDKIDEIYNCAIACGAYGGKIMGAGGGGFFMFYCENGKEKLRKEMDNFGLKEMRFRFDYEGSKVISNI
jgi:D-glycero-alpha-D-manno-heptose-7-phosphate kinase